VVIFLRLTSRLDHNRASWLTLALCTLWIIPSILIISVNCEANKPWAIAADKCQDLVNTKRPCLNSFCKIFLFSVFFSFFADAGVTGSVPSMAVHHSGEYHYRLETSKCRGEAKLLSYRCSLYGCRESSTPSTYIFFSRFALISSSVQTHCHYGCAPPLPVVLNPFTRSTPSYCQPLHMDSGRDELLPLRVRCPLPSSIHGRREH
jgi:hypothetical protein